MFVFLMAGTVHRVRIDPLAAVMVAADLEAGALVRRDAVERTTRYVDVKHGERVDLEPFGPQRLRPEHHLTLGRQRRRERREDRSRPCAGSQHEPLRRVLAGARANANAAIAGRPLDDALARPEVGAAPARQRGVRRNARLRTEEAAIGLKDRYAVGRQPVSRKARRHGRRIELVVRQAERRARRARPFDVRAARRARVDRAGDDEERAAGLRFQRAPQRVRPAHERHVRRMLPVRETDDAAQTVRRPEIVRDVELFQREDGGAARGQVIRCGASHSANADDDRVVHGAPTIGLERTMIKTSRFACAACTLACSAALLAQSSSSKYPAPRKGDVVDDYFGTKVADPYRWMEDLNGTELKTWVDGENAVTFRYLDALPQRDALKARITELWNYPKVTAPRYEGRHWFYNRNSGLQRQSVVFTRETLNGKETVALDPNTLSPDGSIALSDFVPAPDGQHFAYGQSEGGSDWSTYYVRELGTGRRLPDVIRWVKFSDIARTED